MDEEAEGEEEEEKEEEERRKQRKTIRKHIDPSFTTRKVTE